MRFSPLLYLLPVAVALPSPAHHLAPRQSTDSSAIASALSAIFAPFASRLTTGSGSSSSTTGGGASGANVPSPYRPPAELTYTEVAYSACDGPGTSGSNVSRVLVGGCEGGSGQDGSPCVFTQGKNYTIVITYTSPVSVPVNQSRTSLASYDGDQRTAYSGQSFGACSYTDCPITAGVERNYTYPFRTFAAPNFQKLVFNATNGIQGESILCARVPVTFQPSSS